MLRSIPILSRLVIIFLMMMASSTAMASGDAAGGVHELSKSAPILFSIPLPGGYAIPFSNGLLMLVISIVLISLLMRLATRKMSLVPGKLQNAVEILVEWVYNTTKDVLGARLTRKYFWFFGSVFVLIIVNNYLGLIPGVGIITIDTAEGTVPLMRGANTDMNTTLFLGLFSSILWLYWCFREQSIKHFFGHIFGSKGDMAGIMKYLLIPIFFFIGLVECLSIAIRPVAFGARLFGNVYAGESIIEQMAQMSSNPIISSLCVLPFYFLELLIGFIQALVFLLLTAVFLKIQVGDDEESPEHH